MIEGEEKSTTAAKADEPAAMEQDGEAPAGDAPAEDQGPAPMDQ